MWKSLSEFFRRLWGWVAWFGAWLGSWLAWLGAWLWANAVRRPSNWLSVKLRRPPAVPQGVTPYAALYTVADTFNYLGVKVKKYRGLLFVDVVKEVPAGKLHVLTVWQGRDAFTSVGPTFLTDSGLTAAGAVPGWQGVLGDTLEARKPLWSYVTPARFIAVLTAVFLALSWLKVISDSIALVGGAPQVEMTVATEPLNALVDQPIKFKMGARNVRRIGDCSLHFNDPTSEPPGVLRLNPLSDKSYSAVGPSQPQEVPISGTAVREGDCSVVLTGNAVFGLFNVTRPIRATYPVHVWQPVAFGKRSVKTSNGKFCEAEAVVLVGRRFPTGLEIEARVEKEPGVKFIGVIGIKLGGG